LIYISDLLDDFARREQTELEKGFSDHFIGRETELERIEYSSKAGRTESCDNRILD
jgi:hypothetical protein